MHFMSNGLIDALSANLVNIEAFYSASLKRFLGECSAVLDNLARACLGSQDLINRGDRIRTCDLVLPKHPRYQTAPRPVRKPY